MGADTRAGEAYPGQTLGLVRTDIPSGLLAAIVIAALLALDHRATEVGAAGPDKALQMLREAVEGH